MIPLDRKALRAGIERDALQVIGGGVMATLAEGSRRLCSHDEEVVEEVDGVTDVEVAVVVHVPGIRTGWRTTHGEESVQRGNFWGADVDTPPPGQNGGPEIAA